MRSIWSSCTSANAVSSGGNCTPLYLNVYDLTPVNSYLYWLGLGVFHSGIEVHGKEYGFGAHDFPTSGIFEVDPKNCPGFIFRRSIWLGTTNMSSEEFRKFIEDLSGKYRGDSYHLVVKNCNHFSDDVCVNLTGKPIPGWVNRLARLGSLCNCFLPETIKVTAVKHLQESQEFSADGTETDTSSTMDDSDIEDVDKHLLTTTNGDIAFLVDKPPRLAKDLLNAPSG